MGGHLVFYAMQRIPGLDGEPTVQTSAAICHTLSDFELIYTAAAAKTAAGESSHAPWLEDVAWPYKRSSEARDKA